MSQFVDLDAASQDDFPSVNEEDFEGYIPPNPHWDAMEDFEYDLEMLKEREEQERADAEAAAEEPVDLSQIHQEDADEKLSWDVDEEPDEKRRHRYCVTVWNMEKFPNMQALLDFLQQKTDNGVRFLVGQEEIAPKTGNHHLQVYVEWKNPKGFGGMRRLFPKCWIGVPRGTAEHNIAYCTHPDTAVFGTSLTFGTPGQESQGKRTDLHILCEKVMKAPNKGALRDIILEQPVAFVRNHNGIFKLASFNWNQQRTPPYICSVDGPPGSGKSHCINSMEEYLYRKRSGQWWDTYTGQPSVLIDEFHRSKMDLGEYLAVTDEYPHLVEVKHGHSDLCFERLYFASHRTFDAIIDTLWASDFAFDPDQRIAVKRRVDCMATISTTVGPLGGTIRRATIVRCSHKPVPAGWKERWYDKSGLDHVDFQDNGVYKW